MSNLDPLSRLLNPHPGHATVLVLPLDSSISSGLIGLLSKHERAQCHRLSHPSDRRSASVMRGLWKLGAGVLTCSPPQSVGIERDRYGRPMIQGNDCELVDLNVSRTRSCCALILSRGGRCGIDIEDVDPAIVSSDLVRFITSDMAEAARIHENPTDFFVRWTQVEAMLKADGRGLSLGVEAVDIRTDGSGDPEVGHIGLKSWAISPIQTPPGVVGAIATDLERQRVAQVAHGEIEAIWSPRTLCASDD
jgi:4'-phosphopantetheinyl transferase